MAGTVRTGDAARHGLDDVDDQLNEDYSLEAVPEEARVSRSQMTMSAWALLTAMVYLFYGALVAGLAGTQQAFIGMILTVVVYSLINGVLSGWGIRSGLNSVLMSRRVFGVVGAAVTALLIAANTLYYAVFEGSVVSVALLQQTGVGDIKLWYVIVVVGMLPLMLGSVQTWMAKINGLLLPLYVVGIVALLIAATVQHGASSAWWEFPGIIPPEARVIPGWLLTFVLYMGIFLNMPATLEFSRFGRREDSRWHQTVTFGWVFNVIFFLVNGMAGAYLVQTVIPTHHVTDSVGVVTAIISTLGVWGVLFVLITQIRIQTANFYLSSSNWQRFAAILFGVRISRRIWVGIVSAAALALMLTDVFSYLQDALTYQGVFMVTWVGVIITHYALTPADRVEGPEYRADRLPRYTFGLGVWVVSSAIGVVLIQLDQQLPTLSALAPLVGFGASIGLYAAITLAIRQRQPEPTLV